MIALKEHGFPLFRWFFQLYQDFLYKDTKMGYVIKTNFVPTPLTLAKRRF